MMKIKNVTNLALDKGIIYLQHKDGTQMVLENIKSIEVWDEDKHAEVMELLDEIKEMYPEEISTEPKTKWWDTKDLRKLYGIKWYQWWWIKVREFFYMLFNEVE